MADQGRESYMPLSLDSLKHPNRAECQANLSRGFVFKVNLHDVNLKIGDPKIQLVQNVIVQGELVGCSSNCWKNFLEAPKPALYWIHPDNMFTW